MSIKEMLTFLHWNKSYEDETTLKPLSFENINSLESRETE